MSINQTRKRTQRLVLAAVFSALIIAMTFIPYTGYVAIIPGSIEITTLHIVTILAAVTLGWKYGAVIGGVWGTLCIIRATTNPLFYDFLNPLISLFPRIAVGLIVGCIFGLLKKTKMNKSLSVMITAVIGTVTNTILVLTAYYFFGGSVTAGLFALFGNIYATLISLNGVIELVSAVLLVPVFYNAISKIVK